MKNIKKIVAVLLCAVLLLGVMPVVSFSAETEELVLGELYEVYIEEDGFSTLTFTPTESDYYRIRSIGYDDVYVDCYDENGEWVAFDDDNSVDYNFNLPIYFEKDVTYSFNIGCYENYDYVYTYVLLEKLGDKSFTSMALGTEYGVNLDGSGESQWFSFTPERDGYYAFYSENSDDAYGFVYGSYWWLENENDDAGYGWDFYVEAYLNEGETYYFEASAYDPLEEESYTVKVEEVAIIEEINVTQLPYDTTCYKGYIEETSNLSGLELELIYTDGSVVEWSYDSFEDIFGVEVEFEWYVDENDDAYISVWTTFADAEFDINDIENPVESLEVVSMPEITSVEGIDGYYDFDDNFIYDYDIPDEIMVEVTYKDGSKETVGIWDGVNGYGFDCYDYQCDGEYWGIGVNYATIEYFGVYTDLPVNVVENPVESIVLDSAPNKEYAFGDEEYGFYDGEYYSYWLYLYDLEGIELTVNYKDGTSETFTEADFILYENMLNGHDFYIDEIIAYEPGVFETTLYYMGHEVTFDVTITEGSYAPKDLVGDVDKDSEVSVLDASLIQLYLVDKAEFDEYAMTAADVDKDSEISVLDASLIQLFLVGKAEF